ncbi:MAG: Hint domain-containing protein [Methanomicrobiales archaeon]|nr:Hint domain-containing protein [Methanomicrobiales archaeon]
MRSGLVLLVILLCTALAAGCLAPGGNGPPPTPNATYTQAQLKYLLLDHYGEDQFFYCDPDYWPVVRGDEAGKAVALFPQIVDESSTFQAIVARKGLLPPYSNETKLIIYREYKKLGAIPLEPAGDGIYRFSLRLGSSRGDEGRQVSGIVRGDGTILSEQSERAILTCPICLAGETLIDTPSGPIRVKDIQAGTMVRSPRPDGIPEAVPVLLTGRTRVPPGNQLVRIRLSDGRELLASPGHPTLDGRTLGSLAAGDALDGATVTGADLEPSTEEFTYDILPAGGTGWYLANGIPLGSTLA